MIVLRKLFLLFLFLFSVFLIGYYFVFFIPFDQGLFLLKQKKYKEATQQWLEYLEKNPSSIKAQLNVGLSYILQNQHKRALKKYQETYLSAKDRKDRFYSSFNSAHSEVHLKNYDSALDEYQRALKEQKDSKQVKENIEFLLLQSHSKKGQGSKEKNQKKSRSLNKKKREKLQNNKNQDKKQKNNSNPLDQKQIDAILKMLEKKEQDIKFKIDKKTKKGSSSKKTPW